MFEWRGNPGGSDEEKVEFLFSGNIRTSGSVREARRIHDFRDLFCTITSYNVSTPLTPCYVAKNSDASLPLWNKKI